MCVSLRQVMGPFQLSPLLRYLHVSISSKSGANVFQRTSEKNSLASLVFKIMFQKLTHNPYHVITLNSYREFLTWLPARSFHVRARRRPKEADKVFFYSPKATEV